MRRHAAHDQDEIGAITLPGTAAIMRNLVAMALLGLAAIAPAQARDAATVGNAELKVPIDQKVAQLQIGAPVLGEPVAPAAAPKKKPRKKKAEPKPEPAAIAPAPAPAQPAAPTEPLSTEVTSVAVTRDVKAGYEVTIGAWLTVSKECKVGETPKIEFVTQPTNGALRTKPAALNIRSIPGAPKNCVGVSPRGIGVAYRPKARFVGQDTAFFKVLYPGGQTREVTATIMVK